LNEIVTIRDKDWNNLSKYFSIPNPLRNIDFEKVKLMDKKLIPKEPYIESDALENKSDITEKSSKINGKKIIEIESPTLSQEYLQVIQFNKKSKPAKEFTSLNAQTEIYAAKKMKTK
jgi:hypothetical protein